MNSFALAPAFAVLAGSALGGLARFWSSTALQRLAGPAFPWGTLVVNIVGCGLMGFLMTWSLDRAAWSTETRLFITTGLLGGFTTFSAFGYETLKLIEDGSFGRAGANILLNVVVGLIAVWAGSVLVRGWR